jgi:hypothetical protein
MRVIDSSHKISPNRVIFGNKLFGSKKHEKIAQIPFFDTPCKYKKVTLPPSPYPTRSTNWSLTHPPQPLLLSICKNKLNLVILTNSMTPCMADAILLIKILHIIAHGLALTMAYKSFCVLTLFNFYLGQHRQGSKCISTIK